ncbi:MAG TPA: hypothetical protein VHT03_07050 [Rhizomicrobium sp.]|jgi:hypothetical protein|nr:hypothetical protein [Rhizomicrobium sp.]
MPSQGFAPPQQFAFFGIHSASNPYKAILLQDTLGIDVGTGCFGYDVVYGCILRYFDQNRSDRACRVPESSVVHGNAIADFDNAVSRKVFIAAESDDFVSRNDQPAADCAV